MGFFCLERICEVSQSKILFRAVAPLVITRFINCVPRKLFVGGVRWTSNVLDFSLDLTVRKKNLKCLRN